MLHVTIYDVEGNEVKKFDNVDDEFDYVSFVAPTTYGPPALVAPNKNGQGPRAAIEERILYINTGEHGPPMWAIERISD